MNGDSQHSVVYHDPNRWAAVPANNGGNGPTWQWGDELLVGFTVGQFSAAEPGHQCSYKHPFASWLARSTDGGESWVAWYPTPYAGQALPVSVPPGGLDFSQPGFVMRVEGNGYHGNAGAQWYCSLDRGTDWCGPFGFGDLLEQPELAGLEFTGRTAYLVDGPQGLLLFGSVRHRPASGELNVVSDKPFLARSDDGGSTFRFAAWIVDRNDPYRAVMPAPVRMPDGTLVVALRRKSDTHNWIDCHVSRDDGASWEPLSRVGDTEAGNRFNGNPPALIRLSDGRLCCAYGDRTACRIVARVSRDGGGSWGPAQVVRDGFESVNGWPDLGYCRLFERTDGRVVVAYFWCTPERPQTHIAATIFDVSE